MRWKGLIFLAILFILFFVLSLIFTDPWLEHQAEEAGSALVGAKVDIDGLHVSLTDLSLKWKRLQVTNPKSTMRNMIETGETEFDLEVLPLLSDKMIIERVAVTDLRTDTPRETDGKIDRKRSAEQSGFIGRTILRLKEEAESTTLGTLGSLQKNINADSILKLLEIESVEKIESLQNDLSGHFNQWATNLSQLDIQSETKSIENRIKSINLNQIKSIEGFQSALSDVNSINQSIDSLQNNFRTTKSNLMNDFTSARNGLGQIDDWIAGDYQRAIAKAKLPDINMRNIGNMLFGSRVIGEYTQYLDYVGTARTYAEKFKSDEPEKKEPPRLKGQDIYFFNKNARPDFWIKEIILSGETGDAIKLSGEITNIVSDQRQINQTTQFRISGAGSGAAEFSLNGILNYLGAKPEEAFNMVYSGFSMDNTSISDSKFLPEKMEKGIGAVEASLKMSGATLDGAVKFDARNVRFARSDSKAATNKTEQIIQSIMDGISAVNFIARIKSVDENLTFSLSSNLDDIFVQRLKGIAGEEVEKLKKRITDEVENRVGPAREKVRNLVQNQEKELMAQVDRYESLIRDNINQAEEKKKEIEKRIDKEKSKVTDKIKNILPFKKN